MTCHYLWSDRPWSGFTRWMVRHRDHRQAQVKQEIVSTFKQMLREHGEVFCQQSAKELQQTCGSARQTELGERTQSFLML